MNGLEIVYKSHHKNRGEGFTILRKERGDFLRKYIGTKKKVIDLGCRDGQLTSEYHIENDVTGVDIDSGALTRAESNLGIKTIHADLNGEWSFGKEMYDVVVACEFLEHVYFPEDVMKKVSSLLKEGGLFVGTVPHAYSLQSRIKFLFGIKKGTPLEDPTHINQFKYEELKNILQKYFEVIEIYAYVPNRYKYFAKIFPYVFGHDLMFAVRKIK
jgi:2-polyprenyl-3-methyl-5-hydroxy-6-metoxy-1,4-benzoquinol methylase